MSTDTVRVADMVALRPADSSVSLAPCHTSTRAHRGGEQLGKGGLVCVPAADGLTVISAHADEHDATVAAAAAPGATVATFAYLVNPADGEVLLAQRTIATGELRVVDSADEDEVQDKLCDVSCERCGEYDSGCGDGYDGYCAGCADILDAAGHWD